MVQLSRLSINTSAARDIGVSGHNGALINGPRQTPQYGSAVMVQRVSGGPSIGSPLCSETLVSRKAIRLIAVIQYDPKKGLPIF